MNQEETNWPEGLPKFDIERVTRLIRARRSIKPKDFSGELVAREEVELLLANAHWAPNHGKTEPWHFVVFEGKGRERLAEAQAELYREHTPADQFKQAKYDKLRQQPLLCSHVIAICRRRGELTKIPVLEEVEAVAAAVQNLHLSATALGLAGYWSSGGMTYHPALRDYLGLNEADAVLGCFLLGKPRGEWPAGARKADWREKVRWVEE